MTCLFYFRKIKFKFPVEIEVKRQMTKTWWEAPMGGSVLSFLKAE
jgi:hypothetical protein